jgi:hypothetical protein
LLDFTHFFNRNIAVELGYTTSRNDVVADLDVDMYQLGVTVQRHNPNGYAEIAVRTGDYVLTLQAGVDGDVEAVKPGVLNLANAYVTKLH